MFLIDHCVSLMSICQLAVVQLGLEALSGMFFSKWDENPSAG